MESLPDDLLNLILQTMDSDTLMDLRSTSLKLHQYVSSESTIRFLLANQVSMKKFYKLVDFSLMPMSFWNYLDVYNSTFTSRYNRLYYSDNLGIFEAAIRSGNIKMMYEINDQDDFDFTSWEEIIGTDDLEMIEDRIQDHSNYGDMNDLFDLMFHLSPRNSSEVIDAVLKEFNSFRLQTKDQILSFQCGLIMKMTARRLKNPSFENLCLNFETVQFSDWVHLVVKSYDLENMKCFFPMQDNLFEYLSWSLQFETVKIPEVLTCCIINDQPEICEMLPIAQELEINWYDVAIALLKYQEITVRHFELFQDLSKTSTCDRISIMKQCLETRHYGISIYLLGSWIDPSIPRQLMAHAVRCSNFIMFRWIQEHYPATDLISLKIEGASAILRLTVKEHSINARVKFAIYQQDATLLEYYLDRGGGGQLDWNLIMKKHRLRSGKKFDIDCCLRRFHKLQDPEDAKREWKYIPMKESAPNG